MLASWNLNFLFLGRVTVNGESESQVYFGMMHGISIYCFFGRVTVNTESESQVYFDRVTVLAVLNLNF